MVNKEIKKMKAEIGMHTLTDTTTGCNSQSFGKQETLEEAAERLYPIKGEYFDKEFYMVKRLAFINSAKWQAERMYSEEEVNELIKLLKQTTEYEVLQSFRDKVHQFKKK